MQRIRFTKNVQTTLHRFHADGHESCWRRSFLAGEVHLVGESCSECATTVLELLQFDAFAEITDDCFEWFPASFSSLAACSPLFN